MKFRYFIMCMALLSCIVCSCSKTEDEANMPEIPEVNNPEPDNPDPNIPTRADTVSVKIGYHITETEEPLVKTRAGGSNDLIGIQITQVANSEMSDQYYACGVFDDIEKLVFKFVKGRKYLIYMNYFPNAKNVVYNYPDGTFGIPFSGGHYGIHKYTINEPVYYTGHGTGGSVGDVLSWLTDNIVQVTSSRDIRDAVLGTQTRYLGYSEEITISDNTTIDIPLILYMMGIKLNVGNFTEGKLKLNLNTTYNFEFKPGDDLSILFQIRGRLLTGNDSHEGASMQLFYTNASNETYLLATSYLEHNPGTNYVYTFDLTKREDGSIGIIMPDKGMTDEESSFD